MYVKSFRKIILVFLCVILLIQGVLLIWNYNPFAVVVHWEFGLFEWLNIVFWSFIVFEIGTIVGMKLKK